MHFHENCQWCYAVTGVTPSLWVNKRTQKHLKQKHSFMYIHKIKR